MLDRAGNHEAQELLKSAKAHVERTLQVDVDLGECKPFFSDDDTQQTSTEEDRRALDDAADAVSLRAGPESSLLFPKQTKNRPLSTRARADG